MTHSPGPWVGIDGEYIVDARKYFVADCSGEDDSEDNVRLIAVAPELLAALEDLLPIVESNRTIMTVTAILSARAAIAKARGEQ